MEMKLTKHVPQLSTTSRATSKPMRGPGRAMRVANSQQHREQRANQGEAQESRRQYALALSELRAM